MIRTAVRAIAVGSLEGIKIVSGVKKVQGISKSFEEVILIMFFQ